MMHPFLTSWSYIMDTISFFLRRGIQGIQILESIVFAGFLVFHYFSFFLRTVGAIMISLEQLIGLFPENLCHPAQKALTWRRHHASNAFR